MKLLVTGKNGQVASALRRLSGKDLELSFIGRPEMDLKHASNLVELFSKFEPDVIVNAAAYTAVDKAETEPTLAFEINEAGAGRVAAAAASLKIPLIHISTDYVFDGTATKPISEQVKPNPINIYGESKYAGELAVSSADPSAVILRLGWVYSPFGSNFFLTMLRLAETQDEVRVVADQYGLPTSAIDLAGSIVKIARNVLKDPNNLDLRGCFHLSAKGDPISWADFADAIFENSNRHRARIPRVIRISTSEYPTPARRPSFSCLNAAKLEAIHNVQLPHWRDGLSRVVQEVLGTVS